LTPRRYRPCRLGTTNTSKPRIMVSMFRWVAFFLVVHLVLAGGAYVAAGRTTPATIVIDQPGGPIGQQGTLQFTAGASRGFFTKLEASLEQNGKTFPLFDQSAPAPESVAVKHVDADHLQVTRPIGKTVLPDL